MKKLYDLIEGTFDSHMMAELPSQAFVFRRSDGSSFYRFTLTWIPGQMVLGGDLGTLTLTHSQALHTLLNGARWIESSEFDYLMSKSDMQKVYDPDETLSFTLSVADQCDWLWPRLAAMTGDPRATSEDGRARVEVWLKERFETASTAADTLNALGMSDYYGSYGWPPSAHWRIAAMKHGCRNILACRVGASDARAS